MDIVHKSSVVGWNLFLLHKPEGSAFWLGLIIPQLYYIIYSYVYVST